MTSRSPKTHVKKNGTLGPLGSILSAPRISDGKPVAAVAVLALCRRPVLIAHEVPLLESCFGRARGVAEMVELHEITMRRR